MKANAPVTSDLPSRPSLEVCRIVARGLALFLGGFALLNILGGLLTPHFDANLWWIDLRDFPRRLATPSLAVSSVCLVGFAVWPPRSFWGRCLILGCAGALGTVVLANTVEFYLLLSRGGVSARIPIPLSLFLSAALAFIAAAVWRGPVRERSARSLLGTVVVAFACLAAFPLAQMFFFGKTDYRRPADAAVVLGARVYADGRLSVALKDRVRTGCQLYRDGWVRRLIFSGGPGDGAIHETEAMKRMAMQLGVRAEDIWLDQAGLNTQATARNTGALLAEWHASRVLVVSHAYHLPRVKLAYQREGRDVFTVPAKESYVLRQMPFNMAREVAALWVYYLRPLVSA